MPWRPVRLVSTRVEALSKIQDDVDLLSHLDVGGVYREAARRTRITAEDEIKTAENNYWFMQPTLDETWSEIRGGMDGYSASMVDKALTELMLSLTCPTEPAATGRGVKPPPWSSCALRVIHLQLMSRCLSTPEKQPSPTVRPG